MTDELVDKLERLQAELAKALAMFEQLKGEIEVLVTKSGNIVYLLDDAEANHGGLIDVGTLRARNELRLELAKWK